MSTDRPSATQVATVLLVLGGTLAVVLTLGLLLREHGPGNMGNGLLQGAAVGLVLAGVMGWRLVRRPDRVTTFERAWSQTGDERDDAVLTRALAVLGLASFPLTAAAAIEQGMSIHDVIDVPASYTSRVYKNGTAPYTVGNADGVTPGPRTLQMALATSPNTAFVMLSERVGLNNVVDMASRLGLRNGMNKVNAQGQTLKPDGSNGPSTPVSPSAVQTLALPPPVENAGSVAASGANNGATAPAQPQKRKPSRRANTAERRATHNAVERARRETLNGRFLVRPLFMDLLTRRDMPS